MTEENNSLKDLRTKLDKRRIRKAGDSDQLRWGKLEGGNFTLREAKTHIEDAKHEERFKWHSKVWDAQLWSKIKTFLWLLMHRKMLTWENLRKKGFIGPSHCPMGGMEEETMNHLFNTCDWADSIWNWAETILQRTDRVRNSIQETIKNWSGNSSNTQLVNTIWKLIPGFIAWTIWKERNQQVFLNEIRGMK